MIETKIFQCGATSIRVFVTAWKSDKMTPAKFKCVIEHENHSPSAITAERDSALQAERECVESFLAYFSGKDRRAHQVTKDQRPAVEPAATEHVGGGGNVKPVPSKPEKPLRPKPPAAKHRIDDFDY